MEQILTLEGKVVTLNLALIPAITFTAHPNHIFSLSTTGLRNDFYLKFSYDENTTFAQHMGLKDCCNNREE